jgi:transcriptional regulator with XRE-family HTH domain
MGIAAHFEETVRSPATARLPRKTLRLESRSETAGGSEAPVTVHNISATGLLLETEAPLHAGEGLAIDLPEAGLTPARVIWSSGGLHGCAFDEPLTAAVLSAAQLRSQADEPLRPTLPEQRSVDTAFTVRLQRLRKARGLTLAELARRLQVSKPTVWAWEQGKARPVESRLPALAEVLGVELAELQVGESDRRLHDVVERARHQVAAAFGIADDRVRILIEL